MLACSDTVEEAKLIEFLMKEFDYELGMPSVFTDSQDLHKLIYGKAIPTQKSLVLDIASLREGVAAGEYVVRKIPREHNIADELASTRSAAESKVRKVLDNKTAKFPAKKPKAVAQS